MDGQEPIDIYALIAPIVEKKIDDKIAEYNNKSQFNVVDIPNHAHTGIESPRINFSDITGLPVMTAAPTDKPEEGTIRLYNSGGTRKIYAFLSGVWYSATLT